MKKTHVVICGLLLTLGCATIRERRALRTSAEETLKMAAFEVQAANSPDTVRYSEKELKNAKSSLQSAQEQFDKKKYAESVELSKVARAGAAAAVKKSKEMKQKEAEAEAAARAAAVKSKPVPAKKTINKKSTKKASH